MIDPQPRLSSLRGGKRIPLLLLLLLGVAASAVLVYATPWGPWAFSDSAAYLATARNLASGEGFQVLLPSGEAAVLMPPLYPLMLAGSHMLGFPLVEAARWLDVLFFGLLIFLVGLSYLRLGTAPWLALPLAILLLCFPVMLRLFSGIMSEPPFLVSAFGGLFLLLAYLKGNSRAWLVASAAVCALATLARFIGVALLPAGLLVLLLLQHTSWKRRLADTALFTLIYALPLLVWSIWYSQHASATVELAQWNDPWEYLAPVRAGVVDVFWGWLPFHDLFPLQRYLFKLGALVLFTAVIFSALVYAGMHLYARDLRRWLDDRDIRLFTTSALFAFIYLLVFVLIYLFRFPPQDIDERTLLPLYPALLLMLFSLFSLLVRASAGGKSRIWLGVLPWLALLVGVVAYLPRGMELVNQMNRSGAGYTGAAWRASQTVQAVQKLPSHIPIISNDTGAVLFFTGRMAIEINPGESSAESGMYTRYGDDPDDDAQTIFRQQDAALVLFYPSFYWQLHERYPDDTQARLDALLSGLTVYGEYPDGAIYFYPVGE